jgi:hypothetical protein
MIDAQPERRFYEMKVEYYQLILELLNTIVALYTAFKK